MRLAVFSDVHGNRHGLQAVLADIDRRGADVVWCGGDLVGYGAHPGEVVATVQGLGIPTVMGNYDDGIGHQRIACGCDYPDEAAMERGLRSIAWTREHTTAAHRAYLRSLPHRLERAVDGYRVVLVHASPARLNEYLHAAVPDAVLQAHLAATGADVLLFGHTHVPYHRQLNGRHAVNTGSAGKPKHGRPAATYALLELVWGQVTVEIVEVPYDHEGAAGAILATGLPPEFADMLRTGSG